MHFNFYSKNMLQKSDSKLLKSRGGGEEEEEGNIMQNANKEAARHQRIILDYIHTMKKKVKK